MKCKQLVSSIAPDGTPGPAFAARDTANGIGDLTLYPFMLGWTNLVKDLKLDTRLGIYAPTGEYEVGQLANVVQAGAVVLTLFNYPVASVALRCDPNTH